MDLIDEEESFILDPSQITVQEVLVSFVYFCASVNFNRINVFDG